MLRQRREIGAILRDALALYGARLGLYVGLALVVVVPVYIAVFGLGLDQLTSHYDTDPSNGELFLEVGVSTFLTGPLVMAMVIIALQRPDASFRQTVLAGLELFAPVLVVSMLCVASIAAGVLLLIVGALFVAVKLCVAIPATVIEGVRGPAALERSWKLTGGSGWRVFGFLVGLYLILALVSAVIGLPAAALARAVDAEAISLVGRILAEAISLPLAAIALTLMYFDLVERDAERTGTPG
jgi:hypothetical protein